MSPPRPISFPGLAALALTLSLALALATADDKDLFRPDQEEHVSLDPPFSLRRPSKDWLFVDLEVERAREKKAESDYKGYRCRLYDLARRGNFLVIAERLEPPYPPMEKVAENVRGLARRGLVESQVASEGFVDFRGEKAFAIEYVGRPARAPREKWFYSRVDFIRNADKVSFTLYFEVPWEHRAKVTADYKKLLAGLRW